MLCLIYPNCLIPPCVSKITCMLHIAASIIHLKLASDQVTSMLTIYLKKKITQKYYSRRHSPIILLIILLSPPDSMDQPTFPPHPCTPTNLPEVVWDQRQAKDPGHWDLSAIGHATGLKTVKWITWMAPYGSVKVHPWDLLSKRSRKTLSTHWCKFQGPLRLVYLLTFLQRIQQRHRKTRAHR